MRVLLVEDDLAAARGIAAMLKASAMVVDTSIPARKRSSWPGCTTTTSSSSTCPAGHGGV